MPSGRHFRCLMARVPAADNTDRTLARSKSGWVPSCSFGTSSPTRPIQGLLIAPFMTRMSLPRPRKGATEIQVYTQNGWASVSDMSSHRGFLEMTEKRVPLMVPPSPLPFSQTCWPSGVWRGLSWPDIAFPTVKQYYCIT